MALIKSISGIRGTIGGKENEGLSPVAVVKFASAYGTWIKQRNNSTKRIKVVTGRDARISGNMVHTLVNQSLVGLGIDVLDIGLATTPTVEIAVTGENAQGGIIVTASHNPKEWNALKLLNESGEFLQDSEGKAVLSIADEGRMEFAEVDSLGGINKDDTWNKKHIEQVLRLEGVDISAIKNAGLTVVTDCVNSVGGLIIPDLLRALGVSKVVALFSEPNGDFPHNPEPLPANLTAISEAVVKHKADLGIVVDPDVDRLALVNEDGTMFGEEYTLVAVADYLLSINRGGNTVSNLSSTRALRDVTENYGGKYAASAVGEVNVVNTMKETNALIGGEGNGGVILPALHYGRDALVGIALFLSHLASSGKRCSDLRKGYPSYYMSKNKITLSSQINPENILEKVKAKYQNESLNTIDGLKIDFEDEWVHMRKSNTEPIIRIYTESGSQKSADDLAKRFMDEIKVMS